METKFNFNSAICTSLEQSRRLLDLGLKKETADMCWTEVGTKSRTYYVPELAPINMVSWMHTPAWSLHRLIELIKTSEFKVLNSYKYGEATKSFILRMIIHSDDIYEGIVEAMEILIEKYHFLNKEYLV